MTPRPFRMTGALVVSALLAWLASPIPISADVARQSDDERGVAISAFTFEPAVLDINVGEYRRCAAHEHGGPESPVGPPADERGCVYLYLRYSRHLRLLLRDASSHGREHQRRGRVVLGRSGRTCVVVLALGAASLVALQALAVGVAAAAGGTWTQLQSPVSPPARERPGMASGADEQTVVLFGGEGNAGLLDDTWLLDGAAWAPRPPTTSTPARAGNAMAADAARGTVLLFGGAGAPGVLADTWTWDGTVWEQARVTTAPPAGRGGSMAGDHSGASVVLLGGIAARGTFPSDT